MPASKAQMKAVAKYQKSHYDDVKIRVPKGKREEIKERLTALGYDSLNSFAYQAFIEKLEREEGKR